MSDSSSNRSVGDLIVDADAQHDEPPPVVLLQEMEEYEVVSLEDDSMDCWHLTEVAGVRQRCVSGSRHRAGVGYHSSIGVLPHGASNVNHRSARLMRCGRTCTVALLYILVSPQDHIM